MNEMKCKLRNVNLSPEKADGGTVVGACDISLQTEYTEDLHQQFTKQKKVTIDNLKKLGVSGMGLTAEFDMLVLRYAGYQTDLAKIDKASVEFGTNNNIKFRIRAYLADAPGMAENLSTHKGEAMYLNYDDESGTIVLKTAQDDMLDEDTTGDADPNPAAEKRPRLVPENVSDDSETVELTPEQTEAAEKEKQHLLKIHGSKGKTKEDDVIAMIDELFSELADTQMGQGDEHEFKQLNDKHEAGRKLSDPQIEKLHELHIKYVKGISTVA